MLFRRSLVSLVVLVAAGCSSLEGVDHMPAADQALQAREQWHYQQTDAAQVTLLTDLIAVPELTLLIAEAMENNPGLQQTAIALQITYAQKRRTNADRLPQASAGFGGERAEDKDNSYSADLTVSWELDLWNKLSDDVSAAEMDIASSEANLQAARDALAANIMRTWLQIGLQQQLIAIETKRLGVLENNEQVILERYRTGLGELQELDSARSSSATTRATLADYREQLARLQRTLLQLAGKSGQLDIQPVAATFPAIVEPLAGLPEQDLGRRPDLQSGYYQIRAGQYRTNVAYKSLLPSVSLSAALSDFGNTPSEALLTSPAWSLLGQLTAPLFQGGKLRAQAEVAELTAEQSYWIFQETLLNAVNEVDNALGQEQALERQQTHLQEALASARRSAAHYKNKYRKGLADILDLLSVQEQTFDIESQLTQITYNRLANRVDLGLALGLGVSL